jgi:hypothetical protein
MEHGFSLILDMDFLSWNMKHINTIYEVWQGIVCKKYIIVVVVMNLKIHILFLQNVNF